MISIRRQLTRELLGSCLVLLGGGLAAVFFAARDEVVEQFDDALRAKVMAVSTLTEQQGSRVTIDNSNQFMRAFSGKDPQDFFELWDSAGHVLARSESLNGADLPWHPGNEMRPKFHYLSLPNGRPGRATALNFKPEVNDEGDTPQSPNLEVQLVVASDRADLDEALTELLTIAGACGILLLIATWWVVPRVLKRGLQPLERLGEQAARIDAHSLTERFPVASLPAELQPICGRLNDLLARLEQSFERERRFSADLAHELRTPLSELRSQAECALKWPESREPAADRDTLAIATQMEAIVTNLLALARGEQGRLASSLQPVALPAVVEEAWLRCAARAEARQLRTRFTLAPITAQADPALLRSILGNLFDNAADYTPPGGEVTVDTLLENSEAILRIANTTDNLEPADLPKLFDRFWRKEAARTGGKNFGLGLSIARTFAGVMGWTLAATLDDQRRLVFTLRGPSVTS